MVVFATIATAYSNIVDDEYLDILEDQVSADEKGEKEELNDVEADKEQSNDLKVDNKDEIDDLNENDEADKEQSNDFKDDKTATVEKDEVEEDENNEETEDLMDEKKDPIFYRRRRTSRRRRNSKGYKRFWTRTSYYYIYSYPQTFGAAKAKCRRLGAHLVRINDYKELLAVQKMLYRRGMKTAYIGLNDIKQEGTFVWTNGDKPCTTFWKKKEPNNHNNNEDCVEMHRTGGSKAWNDIACFRRRGFVCEKMKYHI